MTFMDKYIYIVCVMLIFTSAHSKDLIAEEIKRIELSAEIARMVADDQAFRFGGTVARKKGIEWEEISQHPLYQHKLAKIDHINEEKIKKIIKEHGWPKISDFGKYTARNTWILVQHMDTDISFQEKILLQMKLLLANEEVIKPDYAYLYDRVQVNKGELQRYGTQGECVRQQWEPKPIENFEEVDKRRAEMEMPTLEEYKKMFKEICI